MKHWLENYIDYSQARYAGISPTPLAVMNHLLFTIGNGYGYSDELGEIMSYFGGQRELVPLSVAFKDEVNFDEIKDKVIQISIDHYIPCRTDVEFYQEHFMIGASVDDVMDVLKKQNLNMHQENYKNQKRLSCSIFEYGLASDIMELEDTDFSDVRYYTSPRSMIKSFDKNTNQDLLKVAVSILGSYHKVSKQSLFETLKKDLEVYVK
jgi:hypothetical protein